MPYLRGYGATRFLHPHDRNGSAVRAGQDVVDFMDALNRGRRPGGVRLGRADGVHRRGAVAGTGQGARIGERIPGREPGANQEPLAPKAELGWWYQYYFATGAV